ncbi:hypothetical protein MGMO_45c00570 [Methyloglobulus morosus KoM1]|uniref:Uncharacterized protein n=1 Tax=Methyloglobulus morosus KoM1 TaxID=1116472 RepID=V5BHP1_9GAMM|nr:hypothetical protein MGMO_45c00570 [Methyloglobulus morosus KoM1]
MSKITQQNRAAVNADLTKLTPTIVLNGIGLMLMTPWMVSTAWAALPGGSLDPMTIPKYATPLYVPPAMPKIVNGGVPGVRLPLVKLSSRYCLGHCPTQHSERMVLAIIRKHSIHLLIPSRQRSIAQYG